MVVADPGLAAQVAHGGLARGARDLVASVRLLIGHLASRVAACADDDLAELFLPKQRRLVSPAATVDLRELLRISHLFFCGSLFLLKDLASLSDVFVIEEPRTESK